MVDSQFKTLQRRYQNNDPVPCADMHGWDTVYAVRYSVVNRELKRHFGRGGQMESALRIDYDDEDVSISGVFEPWQLANGGSGNTVGLHAQFASGLATLKETGKTIPLEGVGANLRATIGLHRVSGMDDNLEDKLAATLKVVASGNPITSGDAASLREAFKNLDNEAVDDDRLEANVHCDSLTGLDLSDCTPHESKHFNDYLKPGLEDWFVANASIFDFAFLTIDIAEQEDTGDFAWIKPTYVAYAVTDVVDAAGNKSADDSIFAILAMTEGREPAKRANFEVSASAIPVNAGVNAAFLISNERFLEKHILPQCHKVFEGIGSAEGDGKDPVEFVVDGVYLSNKSPIIMPLELKSEKYAQLSGKADGRIDTGNFKIKLDNSTVTFDFEAITFPYGANDLLTVELMMRYEQLVGLDENCHFSTQGHGTEIHHISVFPDPEKAAWEGVKSMGVGLLVTGLAWFLGPLIARGGSRIVSGVRSLFKSGASTVAESGSLITKEASQIGETELESMSGKVIAQASENGGAAVMGVEAPAVGEAVTLKSIAQSETELVKDAAEGAGVTKTVTPAEVPGTTRNAFATMMIGQFAGQLFGERTNLGIIGAYKQNPQDLPSVAGFGKDCLEAIKWPGNSQNIHKLTCAGLNGAFVLGFEVV